MRNDDYSPNKVSSGMTQKDGLVGYIEVFSIVIVSLFTYVPLILHLCFDMRYWSIGAGFLHVLYSLTIIFTCIIRSSATLMRILYKHNMDIFDFIDGNYDVAEDTDQAEADVLAPPEELLHDKQYLALKIQMKIYMILANILLTLYALSIILILVSILFDLQWIPVDFLTDLSSFMILFGTASIVCMTFFDNLMLKEECRYYV